MRQRLHVAVHAGRRQSSKENQILKTLVLKRAILYERDLCPASEEFPRGFGVRQCRGAFLCRTE